MSNRLKLTLVAVAVVIGFSSTLMVVAARRQQQRQTAAMTLIRDMDSIDQRLSQASFEFGLALDQFLESVAATESGGVGVVRQAHRTLLESVDQSIAVVSQLKVPDSKHGDAFIAAQRKYLLVQRGIIREDFGGLLRLLEDTSMSPGPRGASIKAIVNAAYTKTEQEFVAVHAAREKFAHEFAIHVTAQ